MYFIHCRRHPCMVLMQPPNAVTRSRREYHCCVRTSWLADCHICNCGKMVVALSGGKFCNMQKVEAPEKPACFPLTSWRISRKARHGRNVFVCLCSPQGVVKERSAFISLSKHILKMCFDGMTNSPLQKARKGVRTFCMGLSV